MFRLGCKGAVAPAVAAHVSTDVVDSCECDDDLVRLLFDGDSISNEKEGCGGGGGTDDKLPSLLVQSPTVLIVKPVSTLFSSFLPLVFETNWSVTLLLLFLCGVAPQLVISGTP